MVRFLQGTNTKTSYSIVCAIANKKKQQTTRKDSRGSGVKSSNNLRIYQIEHNNKLLIEYKGATGMYVLLLIIGMVYSFITIWYLVTHPEHLFKKDST